jgi:hypothetical protein
MKKIAVLLAAVAATFASCQKPVLDEPVEVKDTFTAFVEEFDSPTKTSMNSNKQQLWSAGDELAIFRGNLDADEYKLADECAGTTSGIFKSVSGGAAGTAIPCNVAYYPYAEGQSLKATEAGYELSVELPETQLYAQNSYGVGAFPMVAVTTDVNDRVLKFKNVAGAMNLQFKGTQKVVSVKVEGNEGEALSGAAVVTADDTPSVKMQSAEAAAVVLDCGEGVQLSETEATSFILALPPVELAKGFTVTILDADNLVYTVVSDAKNEILRSGVLVMPEVNLAEVEGVPAISEWALLGDFSDWKDQNFVKTEVPEVVVLKGVEMKAGKGFLLRKPTTEWADKYGAGSVNYVKKDHFVVTAKEGADMFVEADGTYDVYFNTETKALYMMAAGADYTAATQQTVSGSAPEVVVTYWAVVGDMTNDSWGSELKMTLDGDWYVVENVTILKAHQFKFRANGSWDAPNPNRGAEGEADGVVIANDTETKAVQDGKNFSVSADGIYTLSINKAADKVKVVKTGEYVAPEEKPQVGGEKSIWGIVGDVNGWAAPDIAMLTTETKDLFVAKNVTLPKGGFKIRANGVWNDAANYGLSTSGNVKVDCYYTVETSGGSGNLMTEAGTYDIWFDLAGKKVYVMTPGKDISAATAGKAETPLTSTWYLVGSFNNWNTKDAKYKMVAEGGYYVVKNVTLAANAEVKACDGSWNVNRGGSFAGVDKACSVTQGGSNIKVTKAGTYDVYLNSAATKMYFMTPGKTPAN